MTKRKAIVAIVAVIALVAILGVCLVACNSDSYKKKLEKKGYEVEVITNQEELADSSEAYGGEIEWILEAFKDSGEDGEYVTIIKFKKSDAAKKLYDEGKQEISEAEAFGETGYDIYRTGSIVISGTKQGVKDAK